jgi:hypothetical protein
MTFIGGQSFHCNKKARNQAAGLSEKGMDKG